MEKGFAVGSVGSLGQDDVENMDFVERSWVSPVPTTGWNPLTSALRTVTEGVSSRTALVVGVWQKTTNLPMIPFAPSSWLEAARESRAQAVGPKHQLRIFGIFPCEDRAAQRSAEQRRAQSSTLHVDVRFPIP